MQPEFIVDTETVNWTPVPYYLHQGEEFSPAISQDTDGMTHILFYNLMPGNAMDPHVRSMDGITWEGQGNETGTGAGVYPQRLDSMKIAPDQNGHSWVVLFAEAPVEIPDNYAKQVIKVEHRYVRAQLLLLPVSVNDGKIEHELLIGRIGRVRRRFMIGDQRAHIVTRG